MAASASQPKLRLLIFLLLAFGFFLMPSADAQAATSQPPSATTKPEPPPAHRFWDRPNAWLFTGVAVSRTLDYTSTRNMLGRGREELLIPDDVVNSRAGFPALEAAGAATSVGISYIFHRYGHHKMERWVSIVHIGVTSFGAAHNYALKSNH